MDVLEEMSQILTGAYESHVSMPQAELLAGKFLYFMDKISNELHNAALDADAKRRGADHIYDVTIINNTSEYKKPKKEGGLTDQGVKALSGQDPTYQAHCELAEKAEAKKTLFSHKLKQAEIAHVFFRGIAKGKYD